METFSSKNSTQKPQNGQQKRCIKKSSQVLLARLLYSRIKSLNSESFHEWKTIPQYHIKNVNQKKFSVSFKP